MALWDYGYDYAVILQMRNWDVGNKVTGLESRQQSLTSTQSPESAPRTACPSCKGSPSFSPQPPTSRASCILSQAIVKSKTVGILPGHETRVGNRLEFRVTAVYTVDLKTPRSHGHLPSFPHQSRNWHLERTSWPTFCSRIKARTELPTAGHRAVQDHSKLASNEPKLGRKR